MQAKKAKANIGKQVATESNSAALASQLGTVKPAEKPVQSTAELLAAWEKEQPTLDMKARTAIEDTVNVITESLAVQSESYLTIGVRLRKLSDEIGKVLFDSFLTESGVLQSFQVGANTARKWMEQSKVIENNVRNQTARKCLMMFAQRALVVPQYAITKNDEAGKPLTTFSTDRTEGGKMVGYTLSAFLTQAMAKHPEPVKKADEATCEVWAREVLYESNRLRGIYTADFNKRHPKMALGVNAKRIRQSVVNFFDYGEYDAKRLFFTLIRAYGSKFAADSTEQLCHELLQVAEARDWEEGAAKLNPAKPTAYSAEAQAKMDAAKASTRKPAPVHPVATSA